MPSRQSPPPYPGTRSPAVALTSVAVRSLPTWAAFLQGAGCPGEEPACQRGLGLNSSSGTIPCCDFGQVPYLPHAYGNRAWQGSEFFPSCGVGEAKWTAWKARSPVPAPWQVPCIEAPHLACLTCCPGPRVLTALADRPVKYHWMGTPKTASP